MLVLGIESSCDETAVAVLKTPDNLLSSVVASQDEVHAPFGGVVPELASRRHMEVIVPLLHKALSSAGTTLLNIDGIAVTRAPGLIGSILVGLSFAKALSYSLKKPLVGVNHLEGHLNAAHLEHKNIPYPHIGIVISGGHTSLYLVREFGKYKLLGATRDDAAGEAFDKVAKLLGLGYPGGPVIDKTAKAGNPRVFKFARPKIGTGSKFDIAEMDFSFSGLKTAVMLEVKRHTEEKNLSKEFAADMAASFQSTIVETVCRQMLAACQKYKCNAVIVSGGVAANSALRERLKNLCSENGIRPFLPSLKFCTDNAAMIAYVGGKYLALGKSDQMSLCAVANEELGK